MTMQPQEAEVDDLVEVVDELIAYDRDQLRRATLATEAIPVVRAPASQHVEEFTD